MEIGAVDLNSKDELISIRCDVKNQSLDKTPDLRCRSDPSNLSSPRLQALSNSPQLFMEQKSPECAKGSYSGKLTYGTVVRRGPDWDELYADQDFGSQGSFRTGIVLTDTAQNSWAPVKWQSSGKVYFYRWGVRELLTDDSPKYDIRIVSKGGRHIDFTGVSTSQILRRIVYPRWVGFKLDVLRVGDICTVSQSFQVDLHLTMTWKAGPWDNYLHLLSKKDPLWEPQWQPRVYFPNAKQIETYEYVANCDSRKYKTIYVGNELWITVKLDVELILTELFEMQSFPFDCQDLTLEIQCRDPTDKIKLVPLPKIREDYLPELKNERMLFLNVRRSTFTDQEWKFKNTILEIKETDPEDDAFGAKFSKIIVRFKLKRLWTMYLFRVIMVLSLLSAGSLSSFFISYENIGERLNLGVAFVLTTVAFLLVVSQWTPKIPYLTILDKYALSVLMFMLSILLESALSASSHTINVATEKQYSGWVIPIANTSESNITVTYSENSEQDSDTTNWSRIIFGVVLVAMHIFFMVRAYILREREIRKLLASSKTLEYTGVEKKVSDLKITWQQRGQENVYTAKKMVKAGWFHRATDVRQVEVLPLTEEFFSRFENDVVIFSSHSEKTTSAPTLSKLHLFRNADEALNSLIEIFQDRNIEFEVCDVSGGELMPDSNQTIANAVRASSGLKEFPQVFVRGHFHGGLGKIRELERTNNLAHSILEGSDLQDHLKNQLLLSFQKHMRVAPTLTPPDMEMSKSTTDIYTSS